jgi:hypothetical protein
LHKCFFTYGLFSFICRHRVFLLLLEIMIEISI